MDDAGMPELCEDIPGRAGKLFQELNGIGIPTTNIYVNPLVQPFK